MLILRNAYDDRDLTITLRQLATGQDGDTLTLKVGDPGQAVELDGDHQIVISTRPRAPGEAPIAPHTHLKPVEEDLAAPKPAAAPKPPTEKKPPRAKAAKEAAAPPAEVPSESAADGEKTEA